MWNYFYAEKGNKLICVKCTDRWLERATDYLLDNGWTLSAAKPHNWEQKKNGAGKALTAYQLDMNTKDFIVA